MSQRDILQPALGTVIRARSEEGCIPWGNVVHVSDDGRTVWWIPIQEEVLRPSKSQLEDDGKTLKNIATRKHFIKAPRSTDINSFPPRTFDFIDFQPPIEWSLTDEQLLGDEPSVGLLRRSRRNLRLWKQERDRLWAWIEPLEILATDRRTTLGHMLASGELSKAIEKRAVELGIISRNLKQAVYKYMQGGCDKNALLPRTGRSGGVGKAKFSRTKTGRPNRPSRASRDPLKRGYVCSPADRRRLHAGWKKYKKKGVSVRHAYIETIHEYWPSRVQWIDGRRKEASEADLLPPHLRPTIAEFKKHGPNGNPDLAPRVINIGKNRYHQRYRPQRGRASSDLVAVGQLGWIDSTPEDQNLVSAASRLKLLPTSYRTMIQEGWSGYILGLYAGFEYSSTLTGLMALLHAASSKVEWCARYGVEISDDQWLHFMPRRIRGDNGDVKSEAGIATLSQAEVALEVVRAWFASHKGPIESAHRSMHASADHLVAGTSGGVPGQRGDVSADLSACVTFAEKMPVLINAILIHNNDTLVPDLLTVEMRQDQDLVARPTRKAIVEWMIANGYVTSQPTNLDLLRARCLPKFNASVDRRGLRVFDPRSGQKDLIRGLRYWSPWLEESGVTTKGARRRQHFEVLIDPTNISEAWLDVEGMHKLELQTNDPAMGNVALCDWLMIADDDDLVGMLNQERLDNATSAQIALANRINKEGKDKKEAEVAAQGKPPSNKEMRANKVKNRAEELERMKLEALGLNDLDTESGSTDEHDEFEMEFDDDPVMAVNRVGDKA